jgi:hypothetical protein
MGGVIGSNRHWRGFAPPMLALLFLFRLLIPSGYMIAPDHDGRPGLVLCVAPAQAAAGAARHGGHDGRHPDGPAPSKPGERPCPFAALAAPPLPPEPPALAPRAVAAVLAPELPMPPGSPRVAPAAPPPPATGPPLLV